MAHYPLKLTKQEKKDLISLNDEFRNTFQHYSPQSWWVELHGMPRIMLSGIKAIRFLALESGSILHRLTLAEKRKIRSITYHCTRALKKNKMYLLEQEAIG